MSNLEWLKNAASYEDSKDAGKCPDCGSEKVKVDEYLKGERRSLTFVCQECGSFIHLDGGKSEREQ